MPCFRNKELGTGEWDVRSILMGERAVCVRHLEVLIRRKTIAAERTRETLLDTSWRSRISVQQPWVDHLSFLQFASSSGIVGFPGSSEGKKSACNAGNLGSVPGLGRSLGEENGYPLQYSPLGNPMDRAAWRATVHGVARSWTWLSD